MAEEGFKRKLTAILSADVAGYSRLMADDETSTVKILAAYREVIASLIKQHRGRVVDSPGDNVLAEFSSVVDAVQCAVAVQNEIQTRNADLPDNRKMEFRIGVNLGDVIDEEDRIYGDGVNIAARLEAMADPGGICVSKTAFDQIETKLPLGYEYLGEQSVKNIPKPVGTYRVLMNPDAAGKVIGEKRFLGRYSRKTAMATIIILIVVAAGLVSWNVYLQQSKKVEPAASEKMAFPLPDKPSFAILPFDNMSGDPDLEYLCDGITENFIAILSKNPYVFVIARNSSFTYKGKPVKVNKVAEELGVHYVIEGSVQKSEDRLRIVVQLVDALKGRHILSERFDRNIKDFFELQDEIIFEILKSIQITGLKVVKTKSYAVVGTNNLDAHLKYLEAEYNLHLMTKDSLIKARQLFGEAIAIDPDFANAHSLLSIVYVNLGRYYSTGEARENNFEKADKLTEKALEIDNSLSVAYQSQGDSYFFQKKYDMAVTSFKKSIELDPADPWAHSETAKCFTLINRIEEAVYHAKEAIRLDPLTPVHYLRLGRAYYHLSQYEDAIRIYKKVIDLMEKVPWNPKFPHIHLAMVYGELGRDEEARAHMKKVLELVPSFNLEDRASSLFFKDPAASERELTALRKAGAPEHPPSK